MVRLLTQIALTFDGIHTASVRRQLVDVIGSHLIGLDDDPTVGYTGRHLTQEERTAAANALRIAHAPHALYYLEKFTENEGRSYTCNTPQGIGHYRTSATVRKSVVYAVEWMLEDIEHSTYYANRNHTWRMQKYVTDVGKVAIGSQLNSHLYTYAGSQLTRYKPMPLPPDASRMPTAIRRLWQQLTKIPDQQLTAFKAMLHRFLQSPGENGKWIASESSYVERTRRVVELLMKIGDDRWTEFRRAIAECAPLPRTRLPAGTERRAARPRKRTGQVQHPATGGRTHSCGAPFKPANFTISTGMHGPFWPATFPPLPTRRSDAKQSMRSPRFWTLIAPCTTPTRLTWENSGVWSPRYPLLRREPRGPNSIRGFAIAAVSKFTTRLLCGGPMTQTVFCTQRRSRSLLPRQSAAAIKWITRRKPEPTVILPGWAAPCFRVAWAANASPIVS